MVRERNQAADALSKIGSSRAQIPQGVFVQDIYAPSVGIDLVDKSSNETMLIGDATPTTTGHDWRTPFIKYLSDGSRFSDKTENERLIQRSTNYILVDGNLMRKNANSEVLLKCISQDDGVKLLDDIHAGYCGNHAASRSLVGKAFRAGFFWPTAVADVEKLVRRCEGCQFFAKRTHVPAHEIQTILSSWPFACWGLDMIGPFKPAPGNFKFVFVLIDKFSKRTEYMSLVKATSEKVVEFLNQIIHRFGVPNSIITDLGTQFTGTTLWDFCDGGGIVIKYVSVAHPRANDQVERANGMIIVALKKRLYSENEKASGRWMKVLPAVVCSLRTQPSRNKGVSPYFVVYGAEAVPPSDVAFGSPRVEHFDQSSADLAKELNINGTEERRLTSCFRTAKYLKAIRQYHNRNVNDRSFMVGDLVLK